VSVTLLKSCLFLIFVADGWIHESVADVSPPHFMRVR